MNSRAWFHWPVGASVFAGFLAAGVCDAALVLGRGTGAHPWETVALSLGLLGSAGVLAGATLGWLTAALLTAIPGGTAALASDPAVDERIAANVLGAAVGVAALAGAMALGQMLLIARMSSALLAAIATGGLVVFAAPFALGAALMVRHYAAPLVRAVLPRSRAFGRTGTTLLLLLIVGLAAATLAVSRVDWRVLDLGPCKSLGIAALMGGAHGWFWYLWAQGRAWHARLPIAIVRGATLIIVGALLVVGASIPEGSTTYQAVADESFGLRLALRIARALTDRDHDGFSARFGGGDCDDGRADVFPGAEDIAGDGIDQNCEGGDAAIAAAPTSPPARSASAPPRAGAFKGNILVISIDALRADRLGVAGYGRPAGHSLTPALDGLARRGTYFRRAWAQAPNTPRSFPSLVTSRYPSEIAWKQRSANYSPILPSNETFFEDLARTDRRAIGIFSHFYFTADRGISKGFAEWSNDGAGTIAESNKDIAAPRIVPRVIARLKRAAAGHESFVLWTHLFEPHSSYMDHPEFPSSAKGVHGLEERYDFEIAFVDSWIGKILATLDETGLARNTAVVVLADHGEAWGEHKLYFHGQDLSEEQLRVPLVFAIPGADPVVAEDNVALIDVGPTLLDLVGLPPSPAFRGRSLLARIHGQPLSPVPIYAELLPATAWPKHEVVMISDGKKLTHHITDRRYELHDLATDPGQLTDLARDPRRATLLNDLRAKLLSFEERRR